MTINILSDKGEEYRKKLLGGAIDPPASYRVGLYNDSTDQLGDASDVGDITTDPDDGNYQELEYPLGGTSLSQGTDAANDWQLVFETQEFDLVNTTGGYVDAAFVTVQFQAENDGSPTWHLFFNTDLKDGQGEPTEVDLVGTNALGYSATFTDQDIASGG